MARAIANQEIDLRLSAFKAEIAKLTAKKAQSPSKELGFSKKSARSSESISYNVSQEDL